MGAETVTRPVPEDWDMDCLCCQDCGLPDVGDIPHACPHGTECCDTGDGETILCARCDRRGQGCKHGPPLAEET